MESDYYWDNNNWNRADNYEKICKYDVDIKKRKILDVFTISNNEYIEIISLGIKSFFGVRRAFRLFSNDFHKNNPEKKVLATYVADGDLIGTYIFSRLGFEIAIRQREYMKLNGKAMDCLIMTKNL